MKISTAFPGRYLKAGDFADGEDRLQIENVELEKMEQSDDQKPVLYFYGQKRGLVLNKTNANIIASAYGDDTDLWREKFVIVYADKTQFAGKIVDCLRIRIPKVRTARPQTSPADADTLNAELNATADEAAETELPF